VRNGQVTLEGVVANTGDRTIAELQANGVPGAFSVTNNLISASEESKPRKR
jgi:osmotically-inducible protein OsmY